jgi:acyl-CoA thioester hydrolase
MDQPDYKFRIEDRVRWGDVDAARIIFYGAYIRFFEIAETELFRAVGLPYGDVFDELDVWLPRAHLECDFRQAAQLDDLLEVSVYVGRVGTKSLRLNFEVRRKGVEEIVAEAHFVLVAVRRGTFESVPVPEELKRRLAPYTQPAELTRAERLDFD